MKIALEMPPTYRFGPDRERGERMLPLWTQLAWCKAEETVLLVNREFGLAWSCWELLKRFGIERGILASPIKNKLGQSIIVAMQKNSYVHWVYEREGVPRLVASGKTFFFTGRWAENVLIALNCGGRKIAVREGRAVVVRDEDDIPLSDF